MLWRPAGTVRLSGVLPTAVPSMTMSRPAGVEPRISVASAVTAELIGSRVTRNAWLCPALTSIDVSQPM